MDLNDEIEPEGELEAKTISRLEYALKNNHAVYSFDDIRTFNEEELCLVLGSTYEPLKLLISLRRFDDYVNTVCRNPHIRLTEQEIKRVIDWCFSYSTSYLFKDGQQFNEQRFLEFIFNISTKGPLWWNNDFVIALWNRYCTSMENKYRLSRGSIKKEVDFKKAGINEHQYKILGNYITGERLDEALEKKYGARVVRDKLRTLAIV